MQVVLSRFVKADLQDIGDWIARDNPQRTVTFVREIREAFHRIGDDPSIYRPRIYRPRIYRLRPEIGEDARLCVVGRYVILFWIDEDVVRIERVVYGGRDLPPRLFPQSRAGPTRCRRPAATSPRTSCRGSAHPSSWSLRSCLHASRRWCRRPTSQGRCRYPAWS